MKTSFLIINIIFDYKTNKETAVKHVCYKIINQQRLAKTTCNQPQPAKNQPKVTHN